MCPWRFQCVTRIAERKAASQHENAVCHKNTPSRRTYRVDIPKLRLAVEDEVTQLVADLSHLTGHMTQRAQVVLSFVI